MFYYVGYLLVELFFILFLVYIDNVIYFINRRRLRGLIKFINKFVEFIGNHWLCCRIYSSVKSIYSFPNVF